LAVLRRIADSLAPFTHRESAALVCKVVDAGYGDAPSISCDPLEIIDAFGFDERLVAARILHDAMEGLSDADFGRVEQARLAALTFALAREAGALLESGLTPWELRKALRKSEAIAKATLAQLSSEFLASELMRNFASASATYFADESATSALPGVGDDLAGAALRGDDDSDEDVGWFFEKPAPAQMAPPPQPVTVELPSLQGARQFSRNDDVNKVCSELVARHLAACDIASSQRDRHCFVYASVRPLATPVCEVVRGVMCHVSFEHAVLCGARDFRVTNAVFIDGDLTGDAYESCAPAQRRVRESLVSSGALVSVQGLKEAAVGEALQRLFALRATGAIFLAGEASAAAATACRRAGARLFGGLPGRLVSALAEEAGAEVLQGLPDAISLGVGSTRPAWEAKRELRCLLRELEPERRKGCFAFPLLGHRQALLPHQFSSGEDIQRSCWELRVHAEASTSAGPGGGSACSTVVLQAACEPVLRRLHAEVSDCLFEALREASEGPGGARRVPAAETWAEAICKALGSDGSTAASRAPPSSHLAPWLAPSGGEALAETAALGRFAEAFRHFAEGQAALAAHAAEGWEVPGEDGDERASVGGGCNSEPASESLAGAEAVVRRAIRVVELVVGLA